jgi:membrane protease YdiL (CAAX protease family)
LIEEVFFRGVLFTAVRRTSGAVAAVVAPSALYAALHFLGGKLSVPATDVGWEHGFIVLARLFERYMQPLALADSFLALFALGILLSLFRLRTGAIAAGMGLHAAGVAAIAVLRGSTLVNTQDAQAFLVGNYDGVLGWAALLWFVLIIAVVLWRERTLRSRVET